MTGDTPRDGMGNRYSQLVNNQAENGTQPF